MGPGSRKMRRMSGLVQVRICGKITWRAQMMANNQLAPAVLLFVSMDKKEPFVATRCMQVLQSMPLNVKTKRLIKNRVIIRTARGCFYH
ncbi:hypothetical protein ACLOJK_017045 [Asimina triloba]